MNERAKLVQKIERMSELPYRSSLRLNKEDTDTLWKQFLSLRKRLVFDYSGFNLIRILCCNCKCCFRKEKKWEGSQLHRFTLLNSAQVKMDKELDIVTIMRTNRYLRLLIHSFMSKKSRQLLKNQ